MPNTPPRPAPLFAPAPLSQSPYFNRHKLYETLTAQGIALCLWNLDTLEARWSDGAHQLLDIEPYELPGNASAYLNLVHPDDRAALSHVLQQWATSSQGSREVQHRHIDRQGHVRWISLSGELFQHEDGTRTIMAVMREVSQRRERQQALEGLERQLDMLLSTSLEALLIYERASGRIRYGNPRFCELFNWAQNTLQRYTVQQLNWLPEALLKRIENELGLLEETTLLDPHKQQLSGLLHTRQLKQDEHTLVFVGFYDLTRLHQTEAQLRNSEAKFISSFHNSPNACSISDLASGRFIEVNINFAHLLGYDVSAIRGKTSLELGIWAQPEQRTELVQLLKKQPRLRGNCVHLRRKDGSIGEYRLHADRVQLQGRDSLCLTLFDLSNEHHQQDALRESQERLNLALTAAQLGTWESDINKRWLLGDSLTCRLHGLEDERYDNSLSEYLKLVHPKDKEHIYKALDAVINGSREQYNATYRVIYPNGERRYLESVAQLQTDAHGNPLKLIGVLRDVTQQILDQQRLKSSEERFASLFQVSPAPVSLSRIRDGRLIDVNLRFLETFGFKRDTLLNTPVEELHFWASLEARQIAFEKLKKDGQLENYPCEFLHADGHKVFCEVSTRFLTVDGQTCILSTFHNTTHTQAAERALRASQAKFAQAFHSSPDSITITEISTGRYIEVNEGFTQFTGWSMEEAIGRTAHDLNIWANPDDREELISMLKRDGKIQDHEFMGRHKNGEPLPVLLSVTPIELEGKQCLLMTSRDLRKQKQAEERIQHLAYHDALTGLPNRALLLDRLEQQLLILERQKLSGALMFMDLDHFKHINDSLGHACGDAVLQEVAQRLSKQLRGEDTIARLGGDEFVILLFGLQGERDEVRQHVTQIAEKIRRSVAEPMLIDSHNLQITPSIGIALIPDHGNSAERLLMHADLALYKAKDAGRNTAQVFKRSLQQAANKRLQLEGELRQALSSQQFQLHYQPQVALPSRQATGAEALLRWYHPERGPQSPADFIHILEETGLIIEVGNWVIQQACTLLAKLLAQGLIDAERFTLAVNISPRQFRHAQFVEHVEYALATSGIDGRLLKLEITEGIVISDFDDTVAKMRQLKQHGVGFAIDDFGTGYSSLTYLKRMPVDVLKIDQSFVRDCTQDLNDAGIIQAIIAMAHSLNLQLIAEGVEDDAQQRFLLDNACRRAQGYFYSKPLNEADFLRWLAEQKAKA
ncbi:EAL domain-containing protein [Atopomonas hussainii]|uniref:EAL domain-containing protein n=1 Tax=Atopomonas hussainii TaxID=1429083 RepID=UPI0009F80B35|nr:EAL domain-containing protein [Atopomonas hussainii]